MNRCASPDHPHCTTWVMPGEALCEHGHAQPRARADAAPAIAMPPHAPDAIGASFDMLSQLRSAREAGLVPAQAAPRTPPKAVRPHLHISGFDPRAGGGRHAVRLDLRGMPPEAPAQLALSLQSDLLAKGAARLVFTRGMYGEWRPVFIEFSSRGREHGQYRIDAELRAGGAPPRTWVATLVLLVPRADASLGEIHQSFLSTHKNVRIHADDAAIARLHGLAASGPMDIDIHASNASIAQLHFDGAAGAGDSAGASEGGKIKLAMSTLAWDEELIEIDLDKSQQRHPCEAAGGCLVYAEPDAGSARHLRLFALDECVLGRFEADAADADLLLQHHGEQGPQTGGLTRRLSAQHAIIRFGRHGAEIEDVSRYGVLLDGVWPGRHKPVALRLGMRLEFTASIKGVVTLVVSALFEHAIVLHRVDAGGGAECFMLLAPERAPVLPDAGHSRTAVLPRAAALPLLFHRDGGIWHLDPGSGRETPLVPGESLQNLSGFHGCVRFCLETRPEDGAPRPVLPLAARTVRQGERRAAPPSAVLGA